MATLLRHPRRHAIPALLVAGVLAAGPSSAQRVQGADSLRVSLLTFEPGAAVWERFGHNALWIHDPEAGTDIAYHWGLFDMSEAGFMVEFLQGRMVYSMGAADAGRLVDAYRRAGRPVTIHELALTVEQVADLQAFVQWNIRPENRRYRYDYFRDNCSTRVRDALDDAMSGGLRRELTARATEQTYRSQAVGLTADDVLLTTAMDLGLGPLADQPITRWELAYVPMRLRDDVLTLTVDRAGEAVPLVVSGRRLEALGGRDPVQAGHSSAVRRALGHLLAGLLVAGVLAGSAGIGRREDARAALRSAARWGLATVGALWGLVAGALGLILLGLWTLTDHEFAWNNENLLQANPLALALVVLVPVAVRRGGSVAATRVAGLLVALSLVGLILHPLPVTPQANITIIALALPIHLGLFYALWRLGRGSTGASDSVADQGPG